MLQRKVAGIPPCAHVVTWRSRGWWVIITTSVTVLSLSDPVFSALRVYALLRRNYYVALVVFLLVMVPLATNSVCLVLWFSSSTPCLRSSVTVLAQEHGLLLRERPSAGFVVLWDFHSVGQCRVLVSAWQF